ncbi:hypothetical protein D3C81_2106870 [compost metagenome]
MTNARQAELVGFLAADQVLDVEGDLAREGPVQGEQAGGGILVEVINLQVHEMAPPCFVYWR